MISEDSRRDPILRSLVLALGYPEQVEAARIPAGAVCLQPRLHPGVARQPNAVLVWMNSGQ